MKYTILILLYFSIISACCISIYANPFLDSRKDKTPAPAPVISGKSKWITDIQFKYRDRVAAILREMKEYDSGKVIFSLISLSFLYGLFHAAGPGHRKTIIFSLFLSRNAKFFEPAAAGFISAGLHSGASVLLILIIWIIQKKIASLSGTEKVYAYMEGFTFIALAILSLVFIAIKIKSLFFHEKRIIKNTGNKKLYSMIIVSSLVPCPGATMLLLLSIYLGILLAGITGVISMSVGMGVVIAFSGYIAYFGRDRVFAGIKRNEKALAYLSTGLEILSFIIILLFSVYLSLPLIFSLIKIYF